MVAMALRSSVGMDWPGHDLPLTRGPEGRRDASKSGDPGLFLQEFNRRIPALDVTHKRSEADFFSPLGPGGGTIAWSVSLIGSLRRLR